MDARGELKDEVMEENNDQDEEMQDVVDTRSESNYVSLSDDDEQLMLGHDDELDLESIIMKKALSEEEINELIQDLVGVESKAAEAQEALEKESLAKVESEVREELALTLRGVELNKSVAAQMMTFKNVREATLDDLEIESSNLLEQLDGAGIELPKLYKIIESQVPNGCFTEAWRKRAHRVGTQVTKETVESLANAESFLHTHRPDRKRYGKLEEDGASGFLEKKFADDGAKDCLAGTSEKKDEAVSFGSKNQAPVYLESTPQQAASMGLEFPGVNEVEEIEEIDAGLADTIENERELALTEEQKKNCIRVNKEEDDINIDRQPQLCLKRKRHKKSSKQSIYRARRNGTIEEKIYKRQVDRQQVHRNISKEEMLHLSEFDDDDEKSDAFSKISKADSQKTSKKQKVGCCSDKLMENNLLERHNPNWITSFPEHEIFLKENEEEKLTKEEKAFGWDGVQRVAPELQKPSPQTVPKRFNRSRFVSRNCTRTAHQLTLISQGRRVGSSTVCGECGLLLAWEEVGSSRVCASKIDYF